MSPSNANYANVMALIGGIILVVVVGYYAFLGVDSWGLSEQTGAAVVRGKRYEPAKTGYVTQIINNQSRVVPRATPEAYRLDLELDGQRVEAVVSREMYEAVAESQRVNTTYKRGRVTGTLQVTEIKR